MKCTASTEQFIVNYFVYAVLLIERIDVMRENNKKIVFIGVLFIIALATVFLYGSTTKTEAMSGANTIEIFPQSGFFAENTQIEINFSATSAKPAVYYTTDGTLPTKENGVLFDEPVMLEASDKEKIYTYRFKAYYQDGTETDVITRTYFTGKDIDYRYETMVLHLTGDPDGLFGYNNGIFVPGRLFDEFVEANPGVHFGGGVEANFNLKGPEYEREVHVQLFDRDGSVLMENNGGVRIHGNATRMKNQKSFKLYARSEYSPENEFEYALFPNLKNEDTNVIASQHKRLLVRNAGTDNGFAYMRSELAGALAADAGFPDVMYAEPVCVYINGEYQGIYWIENTFDRQYFENRYGEYEGEFVVVGGRDNLKEPDEGAEELVTQQELDCMAEYNVLYNKFSAMDLCDEQNFLELCDYIDVYNYLEYFAIQNYVANLDWPTNNVKVYRYISPTEEYKENTVFDGRYRFLLFDLDYAFGLRTIYEAVGFLWDEPTLERILSQDAPLFNALMKREDCRQYFVNYTCDLINDAMSGENVSALTDEMHASRYKELYHMLEETDIMAEFIWTWEEADNLCIDFVENEIAEIKEFAINRPLAVYEDICKHFSYEQMYQLTVTHETQGGGIKVNSIVTDESFFTGTYFGEAPVTIEACLPANVELDYWLVNGEICYEEKLLLDNTDTQNGSLDVSMVTRATEQPVLQLYKIRSEGNNDYVEIINCSEQEISTRGYFLSDTDELLQYSLPKLILQPNESIRIYGKNCTDVESLGAFCMNFNLSVDECLSLSKEREVVDSVVIPDMAEASIYVKDFLIGKFYEKVE